MQRLLCTAIFSFICFHGTLAQDIAQVKSFADQQYAGGNLSGALKEYQRVLLFDEEERYQEVYSRIADIYYAQEDFENALVYYDFARKATQRDSMEMEYVFKRVLCNYRMERYLLGLSDLYDMPGRLSPYFERKRDLYLAICHFGLDEYQESLEYLEEVVDSEGYREIRGYFEQLEKTSRKYDPDRLELMSMILPGLGQMVAGDLKNGMNSFLLLGGIITYAYFTMISYSILDGTLVLTSWFYRYYAGGHKKAYELGEQRIREDKSIIYRQILEVIRDHQGISALDY